jgi:TRAP-type C4-dicarboxylate transport system permease small subunit
MDEQYLARVLLKCICLGFGLLLIWFILILVGGNAAFAIHSTIFDITRDQFDLMQYCGMGLTKILIIVFFVIPFIAIRLTLDKK